MRPRIEQSVLVLIIRALEQDDLTSYDLSTRLGISVRNTREYMKLLHAQRAIHILSYECHRNGPKVPRWALGNEPDAAYPRRRTPAEQQRLHRSRKSWAQLSSSSHSTSGHTT